MLNFNKISDKLFEFNKKLENIPLLVSVRNGLTYMIPLILLGSMALLLLSLPIPAYQSMMGEIFGEEWKNIFMYVQDGTLNILSLLMVVCVSYSFAIEGNEKNRHISPIIVPAVSLCSFIAISGISGAGFSISKFGAVGIFAAMLTSIISSVIFIKLSSIDFFRINVFTDGAGTLLNNAMSALFPTAITVGIFAVFNLLMVSVFKISDIQEFLSSALLSLFSRSDSDFSSGILFIFLIHILWFFGIHGSNVLEPVAQAIFVPALAENAALVMSGQNPPWIVTKTFLDTFVLMGGCGTTLCLIAAILISGKHKNQLHLAKMSFLPIVFNINELIIFGMPIVLNPAYFIPFLGVPVVLTIVSYLCVYLGFVPHTFQAVEWTTPIFLSGYISTGSINGSILQLFNLVLGTLCYIPFVKLAESVSNSRMKKSLDKVYTTFKQCEGRGMVLSMLSRQDDIGSISRFLAINLEYDLENGDISLFYQPQVNFEGRVTGVEALLRWKPNRYDYIYPPLVIALADEAQLMDRLGYWILETACRDLKKIHEAGLEDIVVSVNVSAVQLENKQFSDKLEVIMKKYDIDPRRLKIEITEQIALTSGARIIDQIIAMKKLGVRLAMDDFVMGHSSLMYLKEYDFDTIKLDGALVKEIMSKSSCSNIISSIISLGKSLNYSVIAEYVEKEEQKHILHELGCDSYQGYLFSVPLPYDDVVEYILRTNVNIEAESS